jgi:hypothetical protein
MDYLTKKREFKGGFFAATRPLSLAALCDAHGNFKES